MVKTAKIVNRDWVETLVGVCCGVSECAYSWEDLLIFLGEEGIIVEKPANKGEVYDG